MSLPQLNPPFDADAYLDWEARQPLRHQFRAGEVFAMGGATDAHVTVAGNLFARLRAQVRGTGCRVYMADMKVHVAAADAFFYPDVLVTCSETDRQQPLYKSEPVLIVEVLSESTAAYDRGGKFGDYRQLPSLREYVLIDPTRYSVEVFRKNQNGRFELYPHGAEEPVTLTSLDVTLAIEDLYEDVSFAIDFPQTAHEPEV